MFDNTVFRIRNTLGATSTWWRSYSRFSMGDTQAPLHLLSAFVAVAEQASFTKAARKLGVGKGTVSRAVSELERQLGTELLHRTTHTVALSTAGVALYERAAPHVAALNAAVLKLPESAVEPSGELRITAPNDLGVAVLPELLVQFTRRYPKISLDIWLTNNNVDLVREGFDLALRAGSALKDSTLTSRRLAGGRVGFFASPEYIARRGKPKQPNDAAHDWLLHRAVRRITKPFQAGIPRFLCDDMLLLRELARRGAGIAILPESLPRRMYGKGPSKRYRSPCLIAFRVGCFWSTPPAVRCPGR